VVQKLTTKGRKEKTLSPRRLEGHEEKIRVYSCPFVVQKISHKKAQEAQRKSLAKAPSRKEKIILSLIILLKNSCIS